MNDGYTPLRERPEYLPMVDDIHTAIGEYYGDNTNISRLERICLAAYKLTRYISAVLGNTHGNKYRSVPSLDDAIRDFWEFKPMVNNITDEMTVCEFLSRAAYKEFMKTARPVCFYPDDEAAYI